MGWPSRETTPFSTPADFSPVFNRINRMGNNMGENAVNGEIERAPLSAAAASGSACVCPGSYSLVQPSPSGIWQIFLPRYFP